MKSIKVIAKEYGVSTRTLRYYEAVCAVRHGKLHGEREKKLASFYVEEYL